MQLFSIEKLEATEEQTKEIKTVNVQRILKCFSANFPDISCYHVMHSILSIVKYICKAK